MRTRLSPVEAVRIILDNIHVTGVETVTLPDALDRVLAEHVESPIDMPQWNNSAMDGYAARASDVRDRCPVELTIVEEIPAGLFPTKSLGAGQCTRLFTGAPVPESADSVIRQEDTTALGKGSVRINDDRDAGCNVRPRGEDIQKGAVVVAKGTNIGPAQLGVLASVAHRDIAVVRRPLVAIMATGDEIVDVDERDAILAGEKIASSNTYTLQSLVQRAGGLPINLGIAKDDPDDLRQRLGHATEADVVVTSGGVSVGEHDYLRPVLDELGMDLKFWRIRMRPGAPVGFGVIGNVPWIGLPGNPVSTMVTFELFAKPAIRKALGHETLFPRTFKVKTAEPLETAAPLQHFLRVTIDESNGPPTARLTGPQGSGILTSMEKADALMIVPEDKRKIASGERLDAFYLDETRYVREVPF